MADRREKADTAPRKRALVSCDRCKLRRARCIRDSPDEPCADCKVSGVHCESKLPRKQRVYGSVETLSLRYRALEALVKGLFPQENIQDVNALFKVAAARNIPMPARDDYTPADIFNDSQRPAPQQPQQHQSRQSQPNLPLPTSFQQTLPSRQTQSDSGHAIESTPPSATSKDSSQHNSLHNPFSEVQETSESTEVLVPTRHGAPHYFGPSSSFRLATTIRALVARYKAVSGTNFPVIGTAASSQYNQTNRSTDSLEPDIAYPSDEEYADPDSKESPIRERRSRKRSRIQMEETDDRWEHSAGPLSTDTIGRLLPSRSLADALVSAYFDQVHIYLPIFHRSMFQLQLEAMYSRKTEPLKDCTDIGWLVALALVFAFGCEQLHEHDPEQAHRLRRKYLGFAKEYFRHLLTTTCLANVQALVLLNLHHHVIGQKSSSWLIIGLAARMVGGYPHRSCRH